VPTMNKGPNIMRKLLRQPAVPANGAIETEGPQVRPSASQNTTYSTRGAIACLDRSPDGQRAVIAGQKVFKILKVDGSIITEDVDLRAIITSYAPSHDVSTATTSQLNIKAVTWSHSDLDTKIITACENGRITLYDLNRVGEGLEFARIEEHERQVHKLAINPFRCNWLLSASHDGTVKIFDLKAPIQSRSGWTIRTWHNMKCNADAVRDVEWSPTDGMEFACSTDAGIVQKWDIRKTTAPILRITAHQTACFSIAWHPDGDHLVSGGVDQHCHVWDMSKKAQNRQKPRYTINTPAPVSNVSWRPACWSATAQGKRAAQIAVAYGDSSATRSQSSVVHIWDLARPALPFKEIEQWDTAPTGLMWNSRDLLWSVDKDGHFTQTDVAFVPKLIDRRSVSTFKFSPTGTVFLALEPRQTPRRSRPSMSSPEMSPGYQPSSTKPTFSASRSDSEEDVVGSFLGTRQRKRRNHTSQPAQSLSTTPPSLTGMADSNVMSLDDAVKVTGIYKSRQTVGIMRAPSAALPEFYEFYADTYLERLAKDAISRIHPLDERIKLATEYFAIRAASQGCFRLAQTWKTLGLQMTVVLQRRAEHHRQLRLAASKSKPREDLQKQLVTFRNRGEETPRKMPRAQSPFESPPQPTPRSLLTDDIESTSNVATPLVRPVRDSIVDETREAMHTPLVEDDTFNLPGPAHSPSPAPVPIPGSSRSSDRTTSSVEGYDFYGMESFSPAIDFVAPVRKPPLRLDYTEQDGTTQRMQPQRHDSGESFQMFSTSGDSQVGNFMSSSGSDQSKGPSYSLRDRVSSWENNLPSQEHRTSIDSGVPTQSDTSNEHITPHSNEASALPIPNGPLHMPALPPILRVQGASIPTQVEDERAHEIAEEVPQTPSTPGFDSNDPNIIETDFFPWPNDPEFMLPAIDPTTLVPREIDFQTKTGAAGPPNASAMVLLFRPLLPPEAIDDLQASAVLKTYHARLNSFQLFTQAALLRNLCVPDYPGVFASAQQRVTVGFFCTDCGKPLENDPLIPGSEWKCLRCKKNMDPCAVCRMREPPEELLDPKCPKTWLWCCGCGHGGHTSCISAWHEDVGEVNSGGQCPLEGCLHACYPGKWRDQLEAEAQLKKQRELEAAIKENTIRGRVGGHDSGSGRVDRGPPVRRDQREVAQSRAVEGVRMALGVAGLDRKKSVKVVAPGEEK
jgi:WD40 repeat protein